MTFESGVALLREFGFPVFVSMWFMWRLEKRMDRLFELMSSLMQATALLAKSVDGNGLPRAQVIQRARTERPEALEEGQKP